MGWGLITVMALQAIRNHCLQLTQSRRCHADCGVPVGTGCTRVTAPGKCQVSQRAFQALPCGQSSTKCLLGFCFMPWFVVRTICSLPRAKWELTVLWGAAGSPRSFGLKCTGPHGDGAQPSHTWLWHREPLLSANFCHSSALARYWLWSIRLFLYIFLLQNRYRNSLQPVRLLWDIFRNTISDPNSPFLYPQGNSVEIVSG